MASFRSLLSSLSCLGLGVVSASVVGVAPSRGIAQSLPLPPHLIDLTTPAGQALLWDSEAQADYVPLMSQFVTQVNQAFCGVASTVMVLNALGIPAPEATAWQRPYFTQENVFNPRTEAVIPRQVIERQGMTLAELAGVFASYPVTVEVYYGSDISLEDFRQKIVTDLAEPGNFVVINYLRRAIGQERGGHISPIAAYDEDTDRFLILDVSRYKYPPVWVSADRLWQATNTIDSVSGKSRGFLLIASQSSVPAR